MKWYHTAAIAAAALIGAGGTATAGYAMHSPAAVTVTRTVQLPPKIITKTLPGKVIIRTKTRTVPGPVRTVAGPPDMTCITALYQNIAGWKAENMPPPNGWWDARCPTPAVSVPQAAPASTPVSGDPVAGTGTGAPCTTQDGYYPGGLPGHQDTRPGDAGFCIPDHT